MIEGHRPIRDAYRDESVASNYVQTRFMEPLGALLHRGQARALSATIDRLVPTRVLEVAPGPARLSLEAAERLRGELVLLDASYEMLALARKRVEANSLDRCKCVQGDAFDLPFPERFDLVYSFRLIRHFGLEDRLRLYEQFRRVLRPNGVLMFDAVNETVSGPLRRADPSGCLHFDALLNREGITSELARTGFRVESLKGLQHRYPLLHKVQVLVAPRARWLATSLMRLLDSTGGEPLEWVVTCRRV